MRAELGADPFNAALAGARTARTHGRRARARTHRLPHRAALSHRMKRLLPLSLSLLVAAAVLSTPASANDNQKAPTNFSEAERALFMSEHLASVKPPTTLRYAFRKSGS